ncbi:pyocin knob domain-containing protein [Flavobacterium sp. I3-2]|uniref:pyocin knob domain-containing protein n=1 Tax=Flavobacterium sp. I3-2 TaxID=2748319 RepID=UPI0015AD9A20|nr:pyocin knob domain-containing protein [Flavobacterium sp. I3-2]
MPEEILKPIHYVNGDLEVSGSVKIKEVENGAGSIVIYDEETKELKKRTGAQIIEDLNLAEAFEVKPETITKTSTNQKNETGHTHELGQDVKNDIAKGVEAQGWGNHAQAGYLKTETDPVYVASISSQMMIKGDILINSDLNIFNTTTGIFICSTNVVAASLTNCPTVMAFSLEVIGYGAGKVFQRITDHSLNKIYIRNWGGASWSAWKTTALSSDIKDWIPYEGANKMVNLGRQVSQSGEMRLLDKFSTSVNTASEYFLSIGENKFIIFKLTNKIFSANTRYLIEIKGRENFSDLVPLNLTITGRYGSDIRAVSSDQGIKVIYYEDDLTGYIAVETRGQYGYFAIKAVNSNIIDSTIKANSLDTSDKLNVVNAPIDVVALRSWANSNFALISQTYTKNQVNDLLAPKLDIEDLNGFVNNVTYNSSNHKITFFKQNAPNIEVDLPIESLIKNASLDGNNLVFTFEDNTTVSVPLNTLLVGVVKEVNGKVPNSQGVITLEIADIPSLSSALDGKSNIRLSNVASDLNPTEKSTFRNKVGAGTVNSVSITLPEGLVAGTMSITDTGTFDVAFAQGYQLLTTAEQLTWNKVTEEAVRTSGDQEIYGSKTAMEDWMFNKPITIADGFEDSHSVSIRQLGQKADKNLDNLQDTLTTLQTDVIKEKLKIDNFQNTGRVIPLVISSEFTDVLTSIPEVTVENAVTYRRNRTLIVSVTLKNSSIADTDVVTGNSIVKLFDLPQLIINRLQSEIRDVIPHIKMTSTDIYSTATNKMIVDFEDFSIKQPFRLTLRSRSVTTFYAAFECLNM